jgi:hypothetical protein
MPDGSGVHHIPCHQEKMEHGGGGLLAFRQWQDASASASAAASASSSASVVLILRGGG